MAKHRQGIFVPRIEEEIAVGALTTGTVVSVAGQTVVDRMYLISMDSTWALKDFTAGEGIIEVGVAHSDYTVAEIAEALDASTNWDRGNLVAREQARRKVRRVGVFDGLSAEEVLNDGKPIRTRLGWVVNNGDGLNYWARNKNAGTFTTGAEIQISGKAFARA